MEQMVHKRMTWFLESHDKFPQEMNGFHQGRSAIDNVITLVSSLKEDLFAGCIPIAIFLDIKAAFYSVFPHAILAAMVSLGLGGRLHKWIESYLKERKIYMCTPNGPTQFYAVEKGVPQGAVLSPLLFNITLMHITRIMLRGVHITIYADDICIWST